jgi:thiosulfate/3-mercaptopyruvate sulfurtransferase
MTHHSSALIRVPELAAALDSGAGSRRPVLFDCRFDLGDPAAARALFKTAHIPGAHYAHLDEDLSSVPGPNEGRHPLPDRAAFRRWLGRHGVEPGTQVVIYDDAAGAFAARLWWLLKWVGHTDGAVLSGGFKAWQAAQLSVSAELTAPTSAGPYPELGGGAEMVVTVDQLVEEMAAGHRLVDVRAPERYSGAAEPLDPVGGHIPGAVNFPFQNSLDAAGLFRESPSIHAQMTDFLAGLGPDQVIASCGSGVTACHLLLAMESVGLPGGRLYAGSWSEWIRNPERPVAVGADPGGTPADEAGQ